MASGHSTPAPSRRAILGGSVAITAALALSASATAAAQVASSAYAPVGEWNTLFSEWHHLEDKAERYEDDRAGDAASVIWAKLMKMPAPDRAALLWKINYLWGSPTSDGYSEQWRNDIVSGVVKDAHRMLA